MYFFFVKSNSFWSLNYYNNIYYILDIVKSDTVLWIIENQKLFLLKRFEDKKLNSLKIKLC